MNNYHKIIILHVVLPPWSIVEFFQKNSFQSNPEKGELGYLTSFMRKSRHWILKWHNLKNRNKKFMKQKIYESSLKCLSESQNFHIDGDVFFVQNLSSYPKFLRNFAIFCKFLYLISKNWDLYKSFSLF